MTGSGQSLARAAIEVCSRLVSRDNEAMVFWVPAQVGIPGNEEADRLAKEAAGGLSEVMPDTYRREASLPHFSGVAAERRPRAISQWAAAHVRPERRYCSPGGSGLRRKQLRSARKPLASRYYQLLSDHAAIGSSLHERMSGVLVV